MKSRPKLLMVDEVAEILRVSPKTVYQWAGLGQIPCYKFAGVLRFDEGEIIAWINNFKREPLKGYNYHTQARGPKKGGC